MIGLALILVTVAGNIAPSQNAWIQAFGLIYPILFIVNLAFLVYWALIKSRYAAIPIIVILFGFNNVFDNFQITFLIQMKSSNQKLKLYRTMYIILASRKKMINQPIQNKKLSHFYSIKMQILYVFRNTIHPATNFTNH